MIVNMYNITKIYSRDRIILCESRSNKPSEKETKLVISLLRFGISFLFFFPEIKCEVCNKTTRE